MAISLDLQNDDELDFVPSESQFRQWIEAALQAPYDQLEQTLRVVGEAEIRELNSRYRGKDSATNVLAFAGDSELLDYTCLGDLVICAPVVVAEADAQGKPVHLQGFDHQHDDDTRQMEALEIKILGTLGYTNPYNV
jgi:probable rRNA maturation factor